MVDLHPTSSTSPPVRRTAEQEAASTQVTNEEQEARRKWQPVVGEDQEIIVAKIERPTQMGGVTGQQHFGIALEGTVDVVNGTELRPHHYIRAVSPDSAAAASGRLRAGDELLEANGQDLFGRSYLEVVDVLRQLASSDVRLVCARPKVLPTTANIYEPSTSAFEHEGSRQTRTIQPPSSLIADRLVKVSFGFLNRGGNDSAFALQAKSEVSLLPSGAGGSLSCDSISTDRLLNEVASVLRSRSLEPLTNLAVWSTHPTHIELTKGDRGLGFSVLDYQASHHAC